MFFNVTVSKKNFQCKIFVDIEAILSAYNYFQKTFRSQQCSKTTGELTVLPRSPSWGQGLAAPSPRRLLMPKAESRWSALWTSQRINAPRPRYVQSENIVRIGTSIMWCMFLFYSTVILWICTVFSADVWVCYYCWLRVLWVCVCVCTCLIALW